MISKLITKLYFNKATHYHKILYGSGMNLKNIDEIISISEDDHNFFSLKKIFLEISN